jgi:hypothetical protein
MKLNAIAVDLSAVCGNLWLNQDTSKIRSGLKLIGLENNGATSCGIFSNFNNSGIEARHKSGSAELQTVRMICRSDSREDLWADASIQ